MKKVSRERLLQQLPLRGRCQPHSRRPQAPSLWRPLRCWLCSCCLAHGGCPPCSPRPPHGRRLPRRRQRCCCSRYQHCECCQLCCCCLLLLLRRRQGCCHGKALGCCCFPLRCQCTVRCGCLLRCCCHQCCYRLQHCRLGHCRHRCRQRKCMCGRCRRGGCCFPCARRSEVRSPLCRSFAAPSLRMLCCWGPPR